MADKYDAFRVAQRLLTMEHIRKTIAGYEVSSGNMSLSEVDNALVELNSLKETVDQYILREILRRFSSQRRSET